MTQYAYAYLRLSEEEFKSGESGSIKNQRLVIRQYCAAHQIMVLQEFVDDGWSGGNFDRPGFSSMVQALQKEHVDFILTKDLSRLGRDMQESSYYAERYFPDHGIRYIAINDNFDSEHDNAMAPFQFAMNDVYIREASRKIKNVMHAKKSAGEYAACPPYGYQRSKEDRRRLIPDEHTAPVVQLIFALASGGQSTRAITDHLNQRGIIPPLKYRVLYRDNFGPDGAARASDLWNYTTVKRILRNEVYLGNTLLGKTRKPSLKSKNKKPVERSKWLVTENTHPPLVDQKTWDLAQMNLSRNSKTFSQYENVRKSVFSGVAFCACCGAAMCSAGSVYKGERAKYWYLQCNHLPKRSQGRCAHPARIKYEDLVDLVKSDLNSLIDLTDAEIDAIANRLDQESREARSGSAAIPAQIKLHQDSILNSDKIVAKLYQDNLAGVLSDERLSRMVKEIEAEAQRHTDAIAALQHRLQTQSAQNDQREKFYSLVKEASHIDTLTPDVVSTFIERIEISQRELPEGKTIAGTKTPYKQDIKISYKFIGSDGEGSTRSVEK